MKITRLVGVGATTVLIVVSAFAQDERGQRNADVNIQMGGEETRMPPRKERGFFERFFGGEHDEDQQRGDDRQDMKGEMRDEMHGDMKGGMMMGSTTGSTTMKMMMRGEMRDKMRGMIATGSMASMTPPMMMRHDGEMRGPQADLQTEEKVEVSIPRSIFLIFKSWFNL